MPESPKWVRVTQKDTGHHITVSRSLADDPGFYVLADQSDAVNADGRPKPPTYRDIRDDKASSGKKAAPKAATEKES